MKKLYWYIRIAIAFFTLLGLISWQFPEWGSATVGAIRSSANWVNTQLHRPAQSVTPSVTATPSPRSAQTSPSPSPSGPPVSPTEIARALPSAPTLTTAPPSPSHGSSATAWSETDCSQLVQEVSWDAWLDTQSITDHPDYAAYYTTWADHWKTVYADLVDGPCANPPTPLPSSQCSDPEAWFQAAAQTHVLDEQSHPENRAWDDRWIGTYTKLSNLWPTTDGCA